MQAIIVTGGKQYNVKEGDVIYIEKLAAEADATVTFDQVLAVVDGENSKFGTPVVDGAKVEAKVLKNGKGKKIRVFKYRPKKDSKSMNLREFAEYYNDLANQGEISKPDPVYSASERCCPFHRYPPL